MHYFWLMIAILTETLGTSALQASQQFTRLWPSVGVVVCYAISFYLMGLTLKVMPVGIVYRRRAGHPPVFPQRHPLTRDFSEPAAAFRR